MQSISHIITPYWIGFAIGLIAASTSLTILWLINSKRLKTTVADLRKQRTDLLSSKQSLATELAVFGEKVSLHESMKLELETTRVKLEQSREQLALEAAKRASAEQQCSRIGELEDEVATYKNKIDSLNTDLTNLQATNAELHTRIEEQRNSANDKLELLQNAEKQLIHQFESLAGKILEEKSKTFTEQNKANLDNILNPLREQLTSFKKKVDDVYVNDSKDRATLKEAIKNLNLENQRISAEANNLARALKGDRKVQGNWGELILERVLEQSGLRKGIEYDTQAGFRDSDNRLLKPDVVIHLPDAKDIIIDSKVSLVAYESYSSAETDEVQKIALNKHTQSIRNHIKGLSEKNYADIKGLKSLDFILMFMPIDAAFLTAFHHDESLFSDAFRHNIVVVTPTTLLATLRTIENIWRYERQNENAKIIAGKAGTLYDKLRGFVDEFEKLGTQISTVQSTYDGVMNKLTRGKGNLIRQANSFTTLGVKVKKPLSKSITEQSDLEDDENSTNNQSLRSSP